MKPTIIIAIVAIASSIMSCSSSKFMNRKYTSGLFISNHNAIKHNCIIVDSTTCYAALKQCIELKKSPSLLTPIKTEKEIIEQKAESIVKKDSVFIVRKKGQNKRFVKKCNTRDVYLEYNQDKKMYLPDTIHYQSYEKTVVSAKKTIKASAILCLIPLVGFALSLTAWRKLKKANRDGNSISKKEKTFLILSTIISLLSTLLLISLIIAIGYGIYNALNNMTIYIM